MANQWKHGEKYPGNSWEHSCTGKGVISVGWQCVASLPKAHKLSSTLNFKSSIVDLFIICFLCSWPVWQKKKWPKSQDNTQCHLWKQHLRDPQPACEYGALGPEGASCGSDASFLLHADCSCWSDAKDPLLWDTLTSFFASLLCSELGVIL